MDSKHSESNVSGAPLPRSGAFAGSLFLWLDTDGYYWRTSHILTLSAGCGSGVSFSTDTYTADPAKEDDEYLLLCAFTERFPRISSFVTFGGTSFLVPYLSQKLRAYGLPDPLSVAKHTDLALRYRALYFLLGLSSRRLADYGEAAGLSGNADAAYLASLTVCDAYLDLFSGDDELLDRSVRDDSLVLTFRLRSALPRVFSLHAAPFYLTGSKERLVLSSHIENEKVRLYFSDFRSYEFLPNEGYAVHRSVSSFVRSSRRIPATRDTAYSLMPASYALSDPERARSFAKAALSYLADSISLSRDPS